MMKISPTSLTDVLTIDPEVFEDSRGCFMEIYRQNGYKEVGIAQSFLQDNFSHSVKGVLRGLHYQLEYPQAKLIQVICGEIFDVTVDIRRGSPTFGQWAGVRLSDKNRRQLFVPEGFAHGFCVLSDASDVLYKCTHVYAPNDEGGILWSDPDLGIDWPLSNPLLSEKDRHNKCLAEIPLERLPKYEAPK